MNIAPDHCREHESAQTDRIPETRSKILSLLIRLGLGFILLSGCANTEKIPEAEKQRPTMPDKAKDVLTESPKPKLPLESVPDYKGKHERAHYMKLLEDRKYATGERYNEMDNLIKHYAEGEPLPERIEKISVAGDPKVGTIVHIMQKHGEPTGKEPSLPMTTAYQELILEELDKAKPKHIFYEGIPQKIQGLKAYMKWGDIDVKSERWKKMYTTAQLFFRSELYKGIKFPLEIQRKREQLLSFWGAGTAYALANQMEIHGVESKTIYKYVKLMSDRDGLLDLYEVAELLGGKSLADHEKEMKKLSARMEKLNSRREKEVISVIQKFLEENPGETVYLIFGGGHDFSNEVAALKNIPTLKTIYYPKQSANALIETIDYEETLEEKMEENTDN